MLYLILVKSDIVNLRLCSKINKQKKNVRITLKQ